MLTWRVQYRQSHTVLYTRKFWQRKNWRIQRIVSHSPKFMPISTDAWKRFMVYALTCLFANFFLANSFYLHGSPKFFPAKYFPCTVCSCDYLYNLNRPYDYVTYIVVLLVNKNKYVSRHSKCKYNYIIIMQLVMQTFL